MPSGHATALSSPPAGVENTISALMIKLKTAANVTTEKQRLKNGKQDMDCLPWP